MKIIPLREEREVKPSGYSCALSSIVGKQCDFEDIIFEKKQLYSSGDIYAGIEIGRKR
jgi:hypothetical protein